MTVKCFQINMHHAKAATDNLRVVISEVKSSYIAFLQEPYIKHGRLVGFGNQGSTVMYCNNCLEPNRAAINLSRDLHAWPLTHIMSRDIAAALVDINGVKFIIASIYMPFDSVDHPTAGVIRLVKYGEENKLNIIICADVNSHHGLWGCNNTNKRGEDLVDFLASTDLHVINRGHQPTFVTATRSEILDITLASTQLVSRIKSWHVDQQDSMSDHKIIQFEISFKVFSVPYRNKKKTDWEKYEIIVDEQLATLPLSELLSTNDIEDRVEFITNTLVTSFKKCCSLKRVKPGGRCVPWWSKQLAELRIKTRAQQRRARLTSLEEDWDEYRQVRNLYNKLVRKQKRLSWRRYCAAIMSHSDAARLVKLLRSDPLIKLGPLEKSDGSYTKGPEETLDFLLETHFPSDENGVEEINPETYEINEEVFSTHRVEASIMSFGSFRAAGPDEIFPALLKSAGENLVPQLRLIYIACVRLGYTPIPWRRARIVFLPKPGKSTYQSANSWRPISLTSTLLKAMERLVDWHLKTPELVSRLKNHGQYAYLKGCSADTAIHKLVSKVEKTLSVGEYFLTAFADIEGAFNKARFSELLRAVRRLGVTNTYARWLQSMLHGRTVVSAIGNVERTRSVQAGCPQGGVLSPFLWNCLVDELLEELKTKASHAFTQAFADDIALGQQGIDLPTICHHMQKSLNIVVNWCDRVGLSINPSKTELILFTLRKKNKLPTNLTIKGKIISTSPHVRYLGVYLDQKLNWTIHCKMKSLKMKTALMQCKRAVGCKWGLSPYYMKWIYTAVVRPALLYGVMSWLPALNKKNCLNQLQGVQRLALLLTSGVMRSVPTAALECLTDVKPIKIYGESLALNTMHRLKNNHLWSGRTHRGNLKRPTHTGISEDLGAAIPALSYPCDFEKNRPLKQLNFEVIIPTKEQWEINGEPVMACGDVHCYTDGSRHNNNTGCAYVIYYEGERWEDKILLGSMSSIFQAEVLALSEAASAMSLAWDTKKTINIYSDSLSAINAIRSYWQMTNLVNECLDNLIALGHLHQLKLIWIPAHVGLYGNEEADALAKEAASQTPIGPEPIMPVSRSLVLAAILEWTILQHENHWQRAGCKTTKELISLPSVNTWKKTLSLCSRTQLRDFIHIITGHSYLRAHLFKIRAVDSDQCTLCENEAETSLHFLGSCDGYATTRFTRLGKSILSGDEIKNTTPSSLLSFIRSTGRLNLGRMGGTQV